MIPWSKIPGFAAMEENGVKEAGRLRAGGGGGGLEARPGG